MSSKQFLQKAQRSYLDYKSTDKGAAGAESASKTIDYSLRPGAFPTMTQGETYNNHPHFTEKEISSERSATDTQI